MVWNGSLVARSTVGCAGEEWLDEIFWVISKEGSSSMVLVVPEAV